MITDDGLFGIFNVHKYYYSFLHFIAIYGKIKLYSYICNKYNII